MLVVTALAVHCYCNIQLIWFRSSKLKLELVAGEKSHFRIHFRSGNNWEISGNTSGEQNELYNLDNLEGDNG